MVLEKRQQSLYEACYWVISAPDYTFRSDAKLEITVDKAFQGDIYLYEGTDRHNATTVIESNSTVGVGAPLYLPVSSKAIIVIQT